MESEGDEPSSEPLRANEGDRRRESVLAGVRVLVVDDERDARELVEWVLSACGAVVETASSTAEAYTRLAAMPFDVLVSDIGMPVEDGLTFMRRLRSGGGPSSSVPAVAVTAYAGREDRARSLDAGFDAHVTKPAEPTTIVALVRELATRRV